jgi:hypothetical protein
MSDIPKPIDFVEELASFVAKSGLRLGDDARDLLLKTEIFAEKKDIFPFRWVFLAVFIREYLPLRRLLSIHGIDPSTAAEIAEKEASDTPEDYHEYDEDTYCTEDGQGDRGLLGGGSIARARSVGVESISASHVFATLLDIHETSDPPGMNNWTDEGLHVPFNTLSHITGRRYPELWIKFDTVRKELDLLSPSTRRLEQIESAPSHVRNGLLSFLADHPDYYGNCFLIMPFRQSAPLLEIQKNIVSVLADFGIRVLRADDYVYSENVFTNIEVFMRGCRFAISVIERAASDQHNANVALEIGYMLGLKKEVCLLKEKTVPSLPSDLQGRLYVEFDMFSIDVTIKANLGRWLHGRRIVPTRQL